MSTAVESAPWSRSASAFSRPAATSCCCVRASAAVALWRLPGSCFASSRSMTRRTPRSTASPRDTARLPLSPAKVCYMSTIRTAAFLAAALLADVSLGAQVAAPAKFSAEDMLKVVTASVQALTDDGRLVAITERRTLDNAETDNYRYGDPTFIAPAAVRFVVIDTTTKQRSYPLGDKLSNVRQVEFTRDG